MKKTPFQTGKKNYTSRAIFGCLVLLIFTLMWSCEYQPNSEYFVQVSQPDTISPVKIQLSLSEQDYMILSYTSIAYNLDLSGRTFYYVQFFLDDAFIYQSTEYNSWFNFDPSQYSIGYHTLTVAVTTNANTKSLADLLKYEKLIFKHEWKVYTDGQMPATPVIKQISDKNGVLRIEWEKYSRRNFQKYVIYRTRKEVDYNTRFVIKEITDSLHTYWEDSSYVGGNNDYWVSIVGSYKESLSDKYSVNYPYPQLNTLWIHGDSACFVWNKTKFYSSMQKIELQCEGYYIASPDLLYSSDNGEDTSVIVPNLRFGTPLKYSLKFFPIGDTKLEAIPEDYNSSSVKFAIGNSFPTYSSLYSAGCFPFLLLEKNDSLYKVDYNTNSILPEAIADEWGVLKVLSNNKQILVNAPNATDVYDLETFHYITTKNTSSLSFISTSFSDQNHVFVGQGLMISLLDFSTMNMLISNINYNLNPIEISPDGNYAFHYTYEEGDKRAILVYKVTESGLSFYTQLSIKKYNVMTWIAGTSASLLSIENYSTKINMIKLYNVTTQSLLYEKQIPAGNLCDIDECEHTISFLIEGGGRYEKLVIVNYLTGDIIDQVNIAPNSERIDFFHGTVYCSNGFSLKTISE